MVVGASMVLASAAAAASPGWRSPTHQVQTSLRRAASAATRQDVVIPSSQPGMGAGRAVSSRRPAIVGVAAGVTSAVRGPSQGANPSAITTQLGAGRAPAPFGLPTASRPPPPSPSSPSPSGSEIRSAPPWRWPRSTGVPCPAEAVDVVANAPLAAGLDPSTDGWVTFNSPLGPDDLTAPPNTYANCTITLAHWQWPTWAAMENDWGMFCLTLTHEMGHLLGHKHSLSPRSVMAPVFTSDANVPSLCTATWLPGRRRTPSHPRRCARWLRAPADADAVQPSTRRRDWRQPSTTSIASPVRSTGSPPARWRPEVLDLRARGRA